MGKSDDSISRRRNKRINRKAENKKDASSKVSSRVAAFIAAKKRRQSGKRRQCQGMCFSLPSMDDPFNDREGKPEPTREKIYKSKKDRKLKDKKSPKSKSKESVNHDRHERLHEDKAIDKAIKFQMVEMKKIALLVSSIKFIGPEIAINLGKSTHQIVKKDGSSHSWEEFVSDHVAGSPSKFLFMCLNAIQTALQNGASLSGERDEHLFASAWGLEFWNCYCIGTDVLDISGAGSRRDQIAWTASTAADIISMKEKEGVSFTGPFLLYLVPTQDKAAEVREVCKPLKGLGIHSVSLHSGASIDHQINGLNNCEPEFLVSTPERLLEVLALKAIDISAVSLLVVDGIESSIGGAHSDAVKSIRQYISGNPRTVVFLDNMNNPSGSAVQKLLAGSVFQ